MAETEKKKMQVDDVKVEFIMFAPKYGSKKQIKLQRNRLQKSGGYMSN